MRRQRGVALITVLLVVAVVTVVTAGMIARQQLSIRSTANQLQVRQAWHYAQGGELLAQSILLRDLRRGQNESPVDHLGEPWAQPLMSFDLEEGGQIRLRIEDATGRFNLNSLVRDEQPNEAAIQQFRRLLLRLNIDAPYAEQLVDWLDSNQDATGAYGAEDNRYLLLNPPYRTADRALQDVSELRLLGMTYAHFQTLAPYVSALPAEVGLNVNTASALLLSTLADGLSVEAAQSLVEARGATGYRELGTFLQQPALQGQAVAVENLTVSSDYFQVISEVDFAERRQVLVSLLQRGRDGRVRVLSRDLGQGGLPSSVIKEASE